MCTITAQTLVFIIKLCQNNFFCTFWSCFYWCHKKMCTSHNTSSNWYTLRSNVIQNHKIGTNRQHSQSAANSMSLTKFLVEGCIRWICFLHLAEVGVPDDVLLTGSNLDLESGHHVFDDDRGHNEGVNSTGEEVDQHTHSLKNREETLYEKLL